MSENKKLLTMIDKATQVSVNLTSSNGFPIFDLMVESYQAGYVSASGLVFYTEDKEVLKQYKEIARTSGIESLKTYFKENLDKMSFLSDLKLNGLKEMTHSEQLAFHHLSSKQAFKETLKKKIYGAVNLIENGEVLIFALSHAAQLDLSIPTQYSAFQNKLLYEYHNNDIKPEVIIKGKAAEKIIEAIQGNPKNILNDFQKEKYFLLIDFTNLMGNNIKLVDHEKGYAIAEISVGLEKIQVDLPRHKNEGFSVSFKDKTSSSTNIATVLHTINNYIGEIKIENFMEKKQLNKPKL